MKITICGDLCVTEENYKLFDDGKSDELFGDTVKLFEKADHTIVNLECALTEKETPIKKFGPNLKGPLNTALTLKKAGFTHCGLSNNHIFDFGKAGLSDTLDALEKAGIDYTGIGENDVDARRDLIISDDNIKIAVLAVSEHEYAYALPDRVGAREYDPYDTNEDIANAKKKADYVVVIYHGGKEYCRYPSPRLLKACRSMVKQGADVVICQHSHCIGSYENFEDGHILYGQGNFHFAGNFEWVTDNDMWSTGFIVNLDFGEKCNISFEPVMAKDGRIDLADKENRTRLLSEFKERNKKLSDGTWIEEWRKFCESKKEDYLRPLENRDYDVFGHFLDCEAHTDVWRELFKTYNWTNEK